MNHPNEGNPEDTSEKLEKLEEPSEGTEKEEETTAPQEEETEPEEEGVFKEWTCDICETVYSNDDAFRIKGYHERICGQCYDRGLMWCIREAWKWRSQIRIDVIRKPREDE